MKKYLALFCILVVASVLCACGVIEENLSVKYGESVTVDKTPLSKYSALTWASSDDSIASVSDGEIKGVTPGSALITAAADEGKLVAEYSVNVEIVPVKSIVLSTNVCEIAEGESYQLSYTLFPEDASDYGLSWKSSDDFVAAVSPSGRITAMSVGQTTISISNKEGFIATCSVTVKKALPNFKELYGSWKNESWFDVGDDGTWMRFDTNPNNEDSDDWYLFLSEFLAVDRNLPVVLSDLGFKGSVYEKMGTTTAMMGKQTESNDIATVSWSYHPDNGLEVLIEVND